MRLTVCSEAAKLWFPIPTALVCNDLTAVFLPKMMERYGVTVTKAQARALCRAIRRYKRRHKGQTLMEAQSAEGYCLSIQW